jgi:hypothetical protein
VAGSAAYAFAGEWLWSDRPACPSVSCGASAVVAGVFPCSSSVRVWGHTCAQQPAPVLVVGQGPGLQGPVDMYACPQPGRRLQRVLQCVMPVVQCSAATRVRTARPVAIGTGRDQPGVHIARTLQQMQAAWVLSTQRGKHGPHGTMSVHWCCDWGRLVSRCQTLAVEQDHEAGAVTCRHDTACGAAVSDCNSAVVLEICSILSEVQRPVAL